MLWVHENRFYGWALQREYFVCAHKFCFFTIYIKKNGRQELIIPYTPIFFYLLHSIWAYGKKLVQNAQLSLQTTLHLMPYHLVLIPGSEEGALFITALHKACHIIFVHIDGAVVGFILLIIFIICTEITAGFHFVLFSPL